MLWAILLVLILFAVLGGFAVNSWLFLILILVLILLFVAPYGP